MISILLLTAIPAWLPQGQFTAPVRDSTPGVETVDEKVEREAKAITKAVEGFLAEDGQKLKPYLSKDGRIRIYSDFRSKEAKGVFKRVETMMSRIDYALGDPDEGAEPLFGFLIKDLQTYERLCDVIGQAGPGQTEFMESSKNTTGFTVFAPEITTYFHDMRVQEEARPDHSIGHNLIHLELHRRYGILPLWIREAIATAAEDMAFGEVYAPWHLNGFVFTASHADWRGKATRKQIEALSSLDALFEYDAKPYRDDLAHLGFAFGVYSMMEEPVALQGFLAAMEGRYAANNNRGGRPEFTLEMFREMFEANYESGFLDRFQKWWKKPPRWNAKPTKRKN